MESEETIMKFINPFEFKDLRTRNCKIQETRIDTRIQRAIKNKMYKTES